MAKTVVGLFPSTTEAQTAKHELINNGYTAEDIRVIAEDGAATTSGYTSGSASTSTTGTAAQGTGIVASIKNFFGSFTDAGDTDREYYSQGVGRGGAVLAVTVPDNRVDSTLDLLEQYGATDVEDRAAAPVAATGTAVKQTAAAGTTGQVIPIVEEELQVGKRQVNRGGVRVYSHVVETPIEENIQLREEQIRVQRVPVNRAASEADFTAFKEGSIELTETAEEAVVSKQARVVEEVTVGKDVSERTQTVRDSVRRTEVDVEEVAPEQLKKTTTSGR